MLQMKSMGTLFVFEIQLLEHRQIELFVEIKLISHSLLLGLQNSTGHPCTSCHLCQPLGCVSETLGDEKYFLVMVVRWLLRPGCKGGIQTAHCPGSFYQQERFLWSSLRRQTGISLTEQSVQYVLMAPVQLIFL